MEIWNYGNMKVWNTNIRNYIIITYKSKVYKITNQESTEKKKYVSREVWNYVKYVKAMKYKNIKHNCINTGLWIMCLWKYGTM